MNLFIRSNAVSNTKRQ